MDWTALIPILLSIGGAIGGAAYARKRGLPSIKAEVDKAKADLIVTLKAQLQITNDELNNLRPKLTKAQARITELEEEVERLERRVAVLYIRIDELERLNPATPRRSRTARTRRGETAP